MIVTANGIDIECESYGDDRDPAVLLVMGLGAQLTRWPMPLIEGLVDRGFRAVRFDNRDVGLSQKFGRAGIPNIRRMVVASLFGLKPRAPYSLADMADDAAGLLDALDIARAHIMGASMGGMIAQRFAAAYPERTLTLTSIMSTTGNRRLPRARREAMAVLTDRPQSTDPEVLIAHGVHAMRTIGSPGYPADPEVLTAHIRSDAARMSYPQGFTRQIAAILADGDRRAILKHITAPTLVIHGVDDPLVPVAGGRDTAANIAGARLLEIPGMGHDLPTALIPTILDAFVALTQPEKAP